MDYQYIDNVLIYIDCQAALTTPLGKSAGQQALRVVKQASLLEQEKTKEVVKRRRLPPLYGLLQQNL